MSLQWFHKLALKIDFDMNFCHLILRLESCKATYENHLMEMDSFVKGMEETCRGDQG